MSSPTTPYFSDDCPRYALKEVVLGSMLTEKEKRSLVSAVDGEYSIMKRIAHPYIAKVLKYHRSATKGEDKCMMVLELAPHGDLQDFTNKIVDDERTYPEHIIRKLLQQAAEALLYSEFHGVSHRDIKLRNILVYGKDADDLDTIYIKLADFGSGQMDKNTMRFVGMTAIGTTGYMAPEILNKIENDDDKTHYDRYASDVWSLCVTFYVLCTLRWPGRTQYIDAAETGEFPELKNYSSDLIMILQAGLRIDPNERISVLNICELLKGVPITEITQKTVIVLTNKEETPKPKSRFGWKICTVVCLLSCAAGAVGYFTVLKDILKKDDKELVDVIEVPLEEEGDSIELPVTNEKLQFNMTQSQYLNQEQMQTEVEEKKALICDCMHKIIED